MVVVTMTIMMLHRFQAMYIIISKSIEPRNHCHDPKGKA